MIVLFILFSSPLYLQTKPAFADTLPCKCVDRATGKTEIIPSFPVSSEDNPTRNEKDQCNNQCKSNGYTFGSFTFNHLPAYNESLTDILWDTVKTIDPLENIKDSFGKALVSVVNGLLIVILQLVGWLFDVAMVLFAWIADANNLNRVISNEGVYFGWKTVRDLLNISFILILLFTAFAIVFQIDKYNKKTTVLTLVIMALLINFSFPITRAIIDASNILMYTIIKNISGGTSALGTLTGATGIQNIINSAEGATTTSLIASIIFVFILMITMLAISLMLVTRIVALALLIIFSPIAFIPLPGNNYGADWWKNLFKYCFFGPIMMFMILIATQIMNYMGKHSLDMKKIASSHTIDNAIVGDMAYFAIPIVILWIGMGMAQKMGVEGAGAVMGRAQKMSKWAGRQSYKLPWRGIKATGIPGGVKQKYETIKDNFQSAREAREARVAGKWPFKVKGALEKDMRRRSEEYKKKGLTEDELNQKAARGDAAAAYRLAEDDKMEQDTYKDFMKTNKDEKIKSAINTKVKQERADIPATNKATDSEEIKKTRAANPSFTTDAQASDYIAEQEMGDLNQEKWVKQEWKTIFKPPLTPDKIRIANATKLAWSNLKGDARTQIANKLSPNNAAALNSIGIVV